MEITPLVRLEMVKTWLKKLADALVNRGKLTQAQAGGFLAACQGLIKDHPRDLDFFIAGDKQGFMRCPDGAVVKLTPNPIRAWSEEEVEVYRTGKQSEIKQLERQFASLPQKTEPDAETLVFWNGHVASTIELLRTEIEGRRRELAEIEAV